MTVVLFIGILAPTIFLFKSAERKSEDGKQGSADPRGPAMAQVTCSNVTSGKDGLEEEDQTAWGLNATDQTSWGDIEIVNEGCGCEPSNGTSGGWISNRKGNEAYYSNNMRCEWTLASPPNTWFELHLKTFETESTFDALHIYSCRDAACTEHTELGMLSGDLEALDSYTYVTSARFVHLIFVSDDKGVKRGFDLRWTVAHIPAGSKCGGGGAECVDRLEPIWSAQHIGIVSALVVCQLFVWCNILRVANQRTLDGMNDRQDEYLALRASGNLPWYWPGAGKPQMVWLQKVIEIETPEQSPRKESGRATPNVMQSQTPAVSRMHTPLAPCMGSFRSSVGNATPTWSSIGSATSNRLSIGNATPKSCRSLAPSRVDQSGQSSPTPSRVSGLAVDDLYLSSPVASLAEWRQQVAQMRRVAKNSVDTSIFVDSSSDESERGTRGRGRTRHASGVPVQRVSRWHSSARTRSQDRYRWNAREVQRHHGHSRREREAGAENFDWVRGDAAMGRAESVLATYRELRHSVSSGRSRRRSGSSSGSDEERFRGQRRARARALGHNAEWEAGSMDMRDFQGKKFGTNGASDNIDHDRVKRGLWRWDKTTGRSEAYVDLQNDWERDSRSFSDASSVPRSQSADAPRGRRSTRCGGRHDADGARVDRVRPEGAAAAALEDSAKDSGQETQRGWLGKVGTGMYRRKGGGGKKPTDSGCDGRDDANVRTMVLGCCSGAGHVYGDERVRSTAGEEGQEEYSCLERHVRNHQDFEEREEERVAEGENLEEEKEGLEEGNGEGGETEGGDDEHQMAVVRARLMAELAKINRDIAVLVAGSARST